MKTKWIPIPNALTAVRYNGPAWVARLMVRGVGSSSSLCRFAARSLCKSLGRAVGARWEYADLNHMPAGEIYYNPDDNDDRIAA